MSVLSLPFTGRWLIKAFLQYKRIRKTSSEPLDGSKRSFLTSLLNVILEKLKWDEGSDPGDMDEDDRAAFEELRKVNSVLLGCYRPADPC